jgi:hypothetical protein
MPDVNWQSYYGNNPDTSDFTNPQDAKAYSDIMKFSDCTNVHVHSKYVAAGSENCVDAVRGSNYTFSDCTLKDGAGISSVTIKGAIDGWAFNTSTIGKAKSGTDIELGQYDNYWYPGRKATRNGIITECVSSDGSPIRVTLWDANVPIVRGSIVKIKRIPKIIWWPYFFIKWIWRQF